MDVAQSTPQGLTIMQVLVACSLNDEGRKGRMLFRVKPTPTRFPTNSLYTLVEKVSLFRRTAVTKMIAHS